MKIISKYFRSFNICALSLNSKLIKSGRKNKLRLGNTSLMSAAVRQSQKERKFLANLNYIVRSSFKNNH